MKDCVEIGAELLYRADDAVEGAVAAAVDEHLRACPSCRAREAEARARIALLRSLPPRSAPPELDRAAREEIEALASSPSKAAERLVARWLGRLPLLSAPSALRGRLHLEGESARPRLRSVRILRFASAAAAVVAVAGTFFALLPTRGRELIVVDVGLESLRNPIALRIAEGMGVGAFPSPPLPEGPR